MSRHDYQDLRAVAVDRWPEAATDWYRERMAIIAVDGKATQVEAERLARLRTVMWWEREGCKQCP